MSTGHYGRGRDLFDPYHRVRLDRGGNVNPGSRASWQVRPKWHSLVYGNGKLGSGRESVVSADVKLAWPVVYTEAGMAPPPPGSKFSGRAVKEDTKKRSRPTTPTLRSQVLELQKRGVVLTAIADTLNVSDRRVKEIVRDYA